MAMEEDDQDSFTVIWVGNQSFKGKGKIKFRNEFRNCNELKEYIINEKDSSVIIVLSNSIPLDTLSPTDLPQICAVYNENIVSLYCLPTSISLVEKYMKKTWKKSCFSYILSLIQKQWFLIGLIFSIFLAYLFPDVGKTGGYIRAEWSIKWGCVMLIFFLSGLSVRTKELVKEFLNIRLHLLVQIYSFLIIPCTVYSLALILTKLSINKTLIVGLIILGSTSTTISSNVIMTKNALGNECAALLNAILGNTLGIFISPALIFYFTKNPIFNLFSNTDNSKSQLDYASVVKNLSLTVLIPLIIGQIIHLLWTKQVTYIREKFYFNQLNSLALLTLAWAIFSNAFATRTFEIITIKDLFILITINAGIFITFSILIMITARLPIPHWQFSKQDSVAIIYCGAAKSLAMAISLINAFYGNESQELSSLLSLPPIMYHVQQLIFGAIEGILLKKWVKKDLNKQTPTKNDNMKVQSNNEENLEKGESEIIDVKC